MCHSLCGEKKNKNNFLGNPDENRLRIHWNSLSEESAKLTNECSFIVVESKWSPGKNFFQISYRIVQDLLLTPSPVLVNFLSFHPLCTAHRAHCFVCHNQFFESHCYRYRATHKKTNTFFCASLDSRSIGNMWLFNLDM